MPSDLFALHNLEKPHLADTSLQILSEAIGQVRMFSLTLLEPSGGGSGLKEEVARILSHPAVAGVEATYRDGVASPGLVFSKERFPRLKVLQLGCPPLQGLNLAATIASPCLRG